MVCAEKPIRSRYFVSPRVVEEDPAPHGGLFSFDEMYMILSRLDAARGWAPAREWLVEGTGWFYPLTLFDRFSPGMTWELPAISEIFRRARLSFSFDMLWRFFLERRLD